jgi:hypothetical protein
MFGGDRMAMVTENRPDTALGRKKSGGNGEGVLARSAGKQLKEVFFPHEGGITRIPLPSETIRRLEKPLSGFAKENLLVEAPAGKMNKASTESPKVADAARETLVHYPHEGRISEITL